MEFDKDIGLLVAEWRKNCGMSQAALGEAIGVTQATVSKIESGRQPPSIKQLLEILQATGKTLGEVTPEITALLNATPKPLWERFND